MGSSSSATVPQCNEKDDPVRPRLPPTTAKPPVPPRMDTQLRSEIEIRRTEARVTTLAPLWNDVGENKVTVQNTNNLKQVSTSTVVPTIGKQIEIEKWQQNFRSLKPRIGFLLDNKTMADFQFLIGNENNVFYGHKLIYAITSYEFYNEFYIKGNDKICLPNTRPDIFQQFNTYVYTDKIKLDDKNVLELFLLADLYEIEHLLQLCLSLIKLLLKDESLQNFPFEILKIKKLCDLHVKNEFIKSIERNFKGFSQNIDLHLLSEENLNLILKSDDLNVESEMEVIQFAMTWAKNSSATSKRNALKDSFKELRFPTITMDELQTCIRNYNGLLTSNEIIQLVLYIRDKSGDIDFPTTPRTSIVKIIKEVEEPKSQSKTVKTLCEQFLIANLKLPISAETNIDYWSMNFFLDKQINVHGIELTLKPAFFKTPNFQPSVCIKIVSAFNECIGRIDQVLDPSDDIYNKHYRKMKFWFRGGIKITPLVGYKLEVKFNSNFGGNFFATVNSEILSGDYCLRMNESKTCVSQILFKIRK